MGFADMFLGGGQGDPYGSLLDEQARRQALKQGISGFGDAILSQGYSRTPRTPFQGIGAGLEGFSKSRDDALQQALRMKLLNRQIGREDVEDTRKAERFGMEKEGFGLTKDKAGRDTRQFEATFVDQERQRQAQAKLSAALADAARRGVTNPSNDPAVMEALAMFKPESAFSALEKDTKPDYMTVGEGGSVFDKKSGKFVTSPGGGGGGPFRGTGMEAQDTNILLNGDPASPVYRASYARQAQPRMTFDPNTGQMVQIRPDMTPYRAPAGVQQQGQAAPDSQGGVSVSQITPPRMTEGQRNKLTTARAGAESIAAALKDFVETRKSAGLMQRGASVAGLSTPLNTSFNVAALLSKSEELFNLGVLNGPDLEIIRRTLPDPSTLRGAATDQANVEGSVKKVMNILKSRVNGLERELNQKETDFSKFGLNTGAADAGPSGLDPEAEALVNKYLKPQGPQVPVR